MSGVRAHIQSNIMLRGIEVVLYRNLEDGRTSVWAPGGDTVQIPEPDVAPDIEPLRLHDEDARALLSALLTHYEGGEDTRSLRRDYDAERKRVDQFSDYFTVRS
jgi:hypothetical protein